MKFITLFSALFLCYLSQGQIPSRAIAPLNPVALKYKMEDLGLTGPVKTAGDLEFDKKGRLVRDNADDGQSMIYTDNSIVMEKYGSVYTYVLNDKNQIISYSSAKDEDTGSFTYDAAGNLIEENSISEGYASRKTYLYDTQNRLTTSTEWFNDEPYSTVYDYQGSPDSLYVTIIVGDDRSSLVQQVFKNGVFINQIFQGASEWENVVLDNYGNWTSYDNVVYGTSEKREITYFN